MKTACAHRKKHIQIHLKLQDVIITKLWPQT